MPNKAPKFDSSKPLYREFSVQKADIDTEARTVKVAFSSEAEVDRGYYVEILDHSPSSIRLDRLQDKGAVLINHNFDKHIGVIEAVSIDADRVGRAVLRFGKGKQASRVFDDIVDGIRSKISVGYFVSRAQLDKTIEGKDYYRITDWQPYEISVVSVPADNAVGVGRNAEIVTTQPDKTNKETRTMENNQNNPAQQQPVDVAKITQDATAAELNRVRGINQLSETFKDKLPTDFSRTFIDNGKSVHDFQSAVLETIGKRSEPLPSPLIGLSDKEVRRFSVTRLILAGAHPNNAEIQKAAAFELEAAGAQRDIMQRNGMAASGLVIPHDILADPRYINTNNRALSVGSSTGGGNTVGTELLGGSFIELLRNRSILDKLGVTILSGLVGNIAIPRQASAATAAAVAEAAAAAGSNQTFDQVTLSPKTVSANTTYSRQLLLQSSLDVENFVRNDLLTVVALKLDYLGLYGSGSSNEPLGLKNITGINTKDFDAAAPTWAEIVDMETLIASDNADVNNMAYAVNAVGRGALKTTQKVSGQAVFLWEQGNTVNGYRAECSNQIASGDYLFGNFADLVMGMWGGLDIVVDPYTGSTAGNVTISAHQSADFNTRHPESFTRGNNTL